MTVYNWLCLFGIPALGSALVGFIVTQLKANNAMRMGIQAMLRDRILNAYKLAYKKGYADPQERLNFEFLYEQYKALKGNGVISDIHQKFLELPVFQDGGVNND